MQYNSFNTQPTFFQKIKNFDYVLVIYTYPWQKTLTAWEKTTDSFIVNL